MRQTAGILKLYFTDALEMTSKPVVDDNGNMLVVSRSARTGTQVYTGASVGKPEMQWAVGYRPDTEVFAQDSLDSYTAIPVTIEHPVKFVDSETWKDVAVGETDGAIKDGSFVRVPFTVRHSKAIKSIRDGKSEISMGYSANLEWTSGVTDAGEKYDFIMRDLKMNHLAIVDAARGGAALRIGDDNGSTQKETPTLKKLVFDGISVSIEDHDAVESGVKKIEANLSDARTRADKAEKALTDAEVAHAAALKDANDAKDKAEAEVVSLTKAVEDAKTTPEQLRDAAKAYASLVDAAKKIAPDFAVTDSMSDADIRKGVVLAKFGDSYAAKGEGFFDALFEVESAKVANVADADPVDSFRQARMGMNVADFADAATKAKTAREKMIAELSAPREIAK